MVDALYLNHFRLQRAPFSIAPDPRFLYLGSRHREALAHLLWATQADGGFVVITGEVGTGKTTLSRCLLEQLPDDTDLAFIINPRLNASELLATLCRELAGADAPVPDSDQARVDRINQLLLDAHARGRRTLLLIDEAQNLATDVLEQLRLLTNLETNERKLLQVILLGQPELDSQLRQPALRQLDQRVTARYHLQPLSRAELEACVRHRLEVAGSDHGLFTGGALRSLYRQSGGIPRLANLIADRALLGAYALDQRRVTAAMVRQATREVRGPRRTVRRATPAAAMVAGLAALLGAGWWFWASEGSHPQSDSTPMAAAQPVAPVVAPIAVPPDTQRREMPQPAPDWARGDRPAAMQAVLERWFVPTEYARASAPCDALPELGLACYALEGSTDDLRRLNLPAVLQARAGDGHLALLALNDDQARISGPEGQRTVPLAELEDAWSGRATLVWQLPPNYRGPLREGDQGAAVDALHQALQETGYLNEGEHASRRYDDATAAAVRRFQSQRGLAVDGIVGPRTWMLLSQAAEPGIPALARAEAD